MRYYILELYHASWFWFVMCSLNAKLNHIRTYAEPCFYFFIYSNEIVLWRCKLLWIIIIIILITVLCLWSLRSPGSRVMLRSVREYGRYQRSSWASPNPIPLYLLPQKNSLLSTRMQNPNAGKFGPCLPSLGLTEPERPGSVLRRRETLRLSPESWVATTLRVRVLGTVSLLGPASHAHSEHWHWNQGYRWWVHEGSHFSLLLPHFHLPLLIFLFLRFWEFWCSCLRTVG